MKDSDHVTVRAALLYFWHPVVLISSLNDDGTSNLAPMSSAFGLDGAASSASEPLRRPQGKPPRTGECVLNLPSQDQVEGRETGLRVDDRLGSGAAQQGAAGLPERKTQVRTCRPDARPVADCQPASRAGMPVQMGRRWWHGTTSQAMTTSCGGISESSKCAIQRVHLAQAI